jgi:hypothetical protein
VVTVLPLAAGPDWGTVPDWLAAVGTLAAFAVALRLLAKELAARREQEEDRRREQASRVACWLEIVEDPDWPPRHWAPDKPVRAVAAVLQNGSEEPVYDCRVHIELDPGASGKLVSGDRQYSLEERTLPPGRTQRSVSFPREDLPPASTRMSFRDAAGRRWTRYPDGRLVEPDRPRHRSRKDYMNAWIARELDELNY